MNFSACNFTPDSCTKRYSVHKSYILNDSNFNFHDVLWWAVILSVIQVIMKKKSALLKEL